MEFFEKFEEMIKDTSKRDVIIQSFAECALRNDLFRNGVLDLPPEQFKLLITYVSIKYTKAFGRPQTVNDLVRKYGLDKQFLRDMFSEERKRLDKYIKQLDHDL